MDDDVCHVPTSFYPKMYSNGFVTIPEIFITGSNSIMYKYKAELQLIPNSDPVQFELKNTIPLD